MPTFVALWEDAHAEVRAPCCQTALSTMWLCRWNSYLSLGLMASIFPSPEVVGLWGSSPASC